MRFMFYVLLFIGSSLGNTITGLFDNDNIKDTLIFNSQNEEGIIRYSIKSSYLKQAISGVYESSEDFCGFEFSICKGVINVIESGATPISDKYCYSYEFSEKKHDWFHIRTTIFSVKLSDDGARTPTVSSELEINQRCLNNAIQNKNTIQDDKHNQIQAISVKLNDLHSLLSVQYKENRLTNSKPPLGIIQAGEMLTLLPITNINVAVVNDIGYFLSKGNDDGKYISVLFLTKVIAAVPSRTVAYFNLGDAYAALAYKVSARKNYQIYIDQMKKNGKAAKIPARVLNAVK